MYKIAYSILFSSVLILSGCGDSSQKKPGDQKAENPSETGTVNIGGSSTIFPISEYVIGLYEKEGVAIKINHSGSNTGIDELVEGGLDIAGSSRKMTQDELKLCNKNGVEVLELEVALDGLTVIVNGENSWLKNITKEELKKLWEPKAEEGSVTKWADVNEEWPAEDFRLFGPGAASGTFDFFTKAIIGETGAIRTDYLSSENDQELVKGIVAEKNGVGFIGMAYYEQNRDKLNALSINGIEPTLKTIQDGTYPLLTRSLYIYVSKNSLKKSYVYDFVSFYLENVSSSALSVGYIPLEEKAMESSKKALTSAIKK